MVCPDENVVSRFLDGGLPNAQASALEEHLDACEGCRVLVSELARGQVPFDAADPPSLGADVTRLTLSQPGPTPRDLLLGTTQGDYRILRRLGTGGMGIVYEAQHLPHGHKVALKVLRAEGPLDPRQVRSLLAEAKAVTAISHPGLVDVLGLGELPDGRPYLVMELLEGQPLHHALRRRGRMSVQDTLEVLDEVLEALAAAHAKGVIHRDLKPSNIFLLQRPADGRKVKLLDFGIAKTTLGTAETKVTALVGTPDFMPPEQARGEPVTPASDLYALGVVAFHMLTGSRLFLGTTLAEVLRMHAEEEPPPPSALADSVPKEVDALVLSLLRKRPEERPRSAHAVRKEVARLLSRADAEATTRAFAAPMFEDTLVTQAAPALGPEGSTVAERPEGLRTRRTAVLLGVLAALVLSLSALAGWRTAEKAARPPTAPPPTPSTPAQASAPKEKSPEQGPGQTAAAIAARNAERGGKGKAPARPARLDAERRAPTPEEPPPTPLDVDALAGRRLALEARLDELSARLSQRAAAGRATALDERTVAVVRRKLAEASRPAELAELETVVRRLETEEP